MFYRLLNTSLCSDILVEINQDHTHYLNATSTISGVRKLSRYYTIMTLQSKTLKQKKKFLNVQVMKKRPFIKAGSQISNRGKADITVENIYFLLARLFRKARPSFFRVLHTMTRFLLFGILIYS